MKRFLLPTVLLTLGVLLVASSAGADDFKRERGKGDAKDAAKDALEGKVPPKLAVGSWMNTEGALKLADLRGKVIVLDFWGVW